MAAVSSVLAAVAITSAAVGAQQQRKAVKAQRRASKEASEQQTATEKIREQQTRRAQARESRVRRAQLLQEAELTGTSGSSGAVGTVAALTAQTQGNEAFLAQQASAIESINTTLQTGADKAAKFNSRAAVAGQISNLASSGFKISGGEKQLAQEFDDFFGKKG